MMRISELQSIIHSGKFCENDIMKCIFGLNDIEIKIFCKLAEKESDVKELARKIKRDRATVQRSIKNLIALRIIGRKGTSVSTN